jgi:phage FluMu protein gp41
MDEAREMLREPPAGQPGCRPGPDRPRRTLDAIVAAVCDRAGVSEQMLASPGKCRKFAVLRGEIAASAVAEGAASMTEVARRFNRDLSSISQAATRWRRSEAGTNPQIPNPVPLKV